MAANDPQPGRLQTLTGEQATVIGSVLLFLFIGARIFSVARLDRETALALVEAAGAPSVILGAAVVSLPPAIFIGGFLMLDRKTPLWRTSEAAAIATAVWLAIGVVFVMWVVVLAGIALVLPGVVKRLMSKRELNDASPKPVLFAAIGVGLLIVTETRPWQPPEIVDLKSGRREIAYVLDADGPWTTLLKDADRSILRVRSEEVLGREVCTLAEVSERSVVQLIAGNRSRGCSELARAPAPAPSPSASTSP